MRRVGRRFGAFAVMLAVVASLIAVEAIGGPPSGSIRAASQKASQKKKGRTKKAAPKTEPAEPAPTTEAPKGNDGGLKFSRDIAPILVANCGGCHNPQRLQGKFDLSTFEALMTGTPTEKVIVPGKPEESHLVLRIKGEETPRMPRGGNRTLSDAAIARIENWVKAGAILDAGIDPKVPLEKYAATPEDLRKAELAKLPATERDKQTEEAGRDRWKKASPRIVPEVTSSTHFLVLGGLPKSRASAAIRAVETQYTQLKAVIGDEPLNLGEKISVYVFNDRVSLVEFARVVENREVESDLVATSKFTGQAPYIALVDPLGGRDDLSTPGPASARKSARSRARSGGPAEGEERSLAGLIAEQLAESAAGRSGKMPRWVSLGLGAQFAARVDPRSTYVMRLHQAAFRLYQQGWSAKASEALGDATKTEEIRAVGLVVLESVARSARPSFPGFVRGMSAGPEKLDDVLNATLGINREQFLRATGEFIAVNFGR